MLHYVGVTCSQRGTCRGLGTGDYTCDCDLGFSGKDCDAPACSQNPCKAGGICYLSAADQQRCLCTLGLGGSLCEQRELIVRINICKRYKYMRSS